MQGKNLINKSNPDQLKILNELETELQKQHQDPENYPGCALMIDGPGGNGKTFLMETIVAYCNKPENKFLALCSAYSG